MTYNDLINVTFTDAAVHDLVATNDVLGVVMPYHWGPANEVNIFSTQEFFEAYPEFTLPSITSSTEIAKYDIYAKVKSYFNNGGSYVAVYRPELNGAVIPMVGKTVTDNTVGSFYLTFKYPGVPNLNLPPDTSATPHTILEACFEATMVDGAIVGVNLTNGIAVGQTGRVVYESFSGQVHTPGATFEGESTYLPTIVANKSQYLSFIKTTEPMPVPWSVGLDYTTMGGDGTEVNRAFCSSDELPATQFIQFSQELVDYQSATIFLPKPTSGTGNKFVIWVDGTERVTVGAHVMTISCNAGVAGAYARVAKEENLNQVASARTYGAYTGVLTSYKTFSQVLTDADNGIVSVYTSTTGPQIFGVRNSYAQTKASSYFSKCNVTRVLTAILRNIKPMCIDAIHTATAANEVLRAQFESRLNTVITTFIGNQCLQADSVAICNASNNSDAQTQGGMILNILLSLHFIGLVERVNIKVVATDTSVTAEVI